jgi:hypothetical protein
MITSIVPNGTAPDEPAEMRKRFRRNTIAKMRLRKYWALELGRGKIYVRGECGGGQEWVLLLICTSEGGVDSARDIPADTII